MASKKILYIDRIVFGRKKSFCKRLKARFKDKKFLGQEGFFKASLFYRFDVTDKDIDYLSANIATINRRYDAVVIDWQVKAGGYLADYSDLAFIGRLSIPAVLFCGNAEAGVIPSDQLLDLFHVVFKREHYKDLDRYPISFVNKNKLCTTMLACKAALLTRNTLSTFDIARYGRTGYGASSQTDVFFIGQATHQERIEIVRTLRTSGFRFEGGIYPLSKRMQKANTNNIDPVTYKDVNCPRLDSATYFNKMAASRINLCLSGFGEFTFRHQEAWLYNCFTLCEAVIDELEIPIRVTPYDDYVPFDNHDDLLEKTAFYLNHEDERRRIADNARKHFVEGYSLQKHSEYIEKHMFG